VINNDVRLHAQTMDTLRVARAVTKALFVSAVGVTAEQFDPNAPVPISVAARTFAARGGPDFSCFLISKTGHERFPFDEAFVPAFCEDLDMHRRYMLEGEGDRIFSINLPFHHVGHGSQTLKSMDPDRRAAHERLIQVRRAYDFSAWGGQLNQERYTIKHDPARAQDGVTTPELQTLGMASAAERSRNQTMAPSGSISVNDLPHA